MSRSRTPLLVGRPAPDFSLRAINGEDVGLAECLLEGPLLLEFIRGTWCPNARKRLEELARERARFRELWTRVVVVVCEDRFTVERYFAARPSPLTVVVDNERRVARSYGVHLRFGLGSWNTARPSSILIDRAGFVRYVFVARIQTEVCDVETLFEECGKLSREGG